MADTVTGEEAMGQRQRPMEGPSRAAEERVPTISLRDLLGQQQPAGLSSIDEPQRTLLSDHRSTGLVEDEEDEAATLPEDTPPQNTHKVPAAKEGPPLEQRPARRSLRLGMLRTAAQSAANAAMRRAHGAIDSLNPIPIPPPLAVIQDDDPSR